MKKKLKAIDRHQIAAGCISILGFLLIWQFAVSFTAIGGDTAWSFRDTDRFLSQLGRPDRP